MTIFIQVKKLVVLCFENKNGYCFSSFTGFNFLIVRTVLKCLGVLVQIFQNLMCFVTEQYFKKAISVQSVQHFYIIISLKFFKTSCSVLRKQNWKCVTQIVSHISSSSFKLKELIALCYESSNVYYCSSSSEFNVLYYENIK